MISTPFAPVSPLRSFLTGFAAGTGAAFGASLLGGLVTALIAAYMSEDVVGANIGAGLAGTATVIVIAPILAWLLLRLAKAASPLLTAVLSFPVQLVLLMVATSAGIAVDDWLWTSAPALAEAVPTMVPFVVMDVIAIGVSVAIAALAVNWFRSRRTSAALPAQSSDQRQPEAL
ncbi:hypothetical protein [Nocardiopsis ansamitocini]|nr:hypothetical protein [Nocardiopsis ansamitocini]